MFSAEALGFWSSRPGLTRPIRTARPGLHEAHKIIQSGPYAILRHPIYWGLLMSFLGTAICEGCIGSAFGVVCGVIAFNHKIRIEEGFLMSRPGYAEYCRSTP
jgi:protein-S-isoprenylcysteine O-methyltransferase Ste14